MELKNHDFFEQELTKYDLTLSQLRKFNLRPFGGFIRDTFHQEEPKDLDLYISLLEAHVSGGTYTASPGEILNYLIGYYTDLGWTAEKISPTFKTVADSALAGEDHYHFLMNHVYRFTKNHKKIDLVIFDPALKQCLYANYDFSCNNFIYDPYQKQIYIPEIPEDYVKKFYQNLEEKILYAIHPRSPNRIERLSKLLERGWQFHWQSFAHFLLKNQFNANKLIQAMPQKAKEIFYATSLTHERTSLRKYAAKFTFEELNNDSQLFLALIFLRFFQFP